MTIYLRILPLSLERDNTMWRRVDDLWWSFPFAWSFPCLASLAILSCSWASCFLACTLSLSTFCHAIFLLFDLWHFVGPSASLIISCSLLICFHKWSSVGEGFGSIDLFFHFWWVSALIADCVLWHSPSSSLIHIVLPSMMTELCLLCTKLLEFIMCLASSPIGIHLVTYQYWIMSFMGLVQQNDQYLL